MMFSFHLTERPIVYLQTSRILQARKWKTDLKEECRDYRAAKISSKADKSQQPMNWNIPMSEASSNCVLQRTWSMGDIVPSFAPLFWILTMFIRLDKRMTDIVAAIVLTVAGPLPIFSWSKLFMTNSLSSPIFTSKRNATTPSAKITKNNNWIIFATGKSKIHLTIILLKEFKKKALNPSKGVGFRSYREKNENNFQTSVSFPLVDEQRMAIFWKPISHFCYLIPPEQASSSLQAPKTRRGEEE